MAIADKDVDSACLSQSTFRVFATKVYLGRGEPHQGIRTVGRMRSTRDDRVKDSCGSSSLGHRWRETCGAVLFLFCGRSATQSCRRFRTGSFSQPTCHRKYTRLVEICKKELPTAAMKNTRAG